MAEIKADVREMQARGNYGDGKPRPDDPGSSAGFWSDGQHLQNGAKMGGEGLREYR
jgi:hypothetical protein